jgi:hypothetical protein
VDRVTAEYAKLFKDGTTYAQKLFDEGKIRLPVDMPVQLQLGITADVFARIQLSDVLSRLGIVEGAGQLIALNRWSYDRTGSGNYVRPDVFIDLGPGLRFWLDGKFTLLDVADSAALNRIAREYFRFTGSTNGVFVTPNDIYPLRNPVFNGRGRK